MDPTLLGILLVGALFFWPRKRKKTNWENPEQVGKIPKKKKKNRKGHQKQKKDGKITWPQLGPFFVPACPPLTAINGY